MSLYTKIVSHLFNAGVKPFIPKMKFKTGGLNIPKETGLNIGTTILENLGRFKQHYMVLRFPPYLNCMSSSTNQPQIYHNFILTDRIAVTSPKNPFTWHHFLWTS